MYSFSLKTLPFFSAYFLENSIDEISKWQRTQLFSYTALNSHTGQYERFLVKLSKLIASHSGESFGGIALRKRSQLTLSGCKIILSLSSKKCIPAMAISVTDSDGVRKSLFKK